MDKKTVSDMRYELEQFVILSDETPDDIIRGLWQCAKMAMDTRLPQSVRSTMEFLFTTFESGNGSWDIRYQELRSQLGRNASSLDDYVGEWIDSDEMDART